MDADPLRPILIIHRDINEQGRQVFRREFKCPHCIESYWMNISYVKHLQEKHLCMRCENVYKELPGHECVQVGSGIHNPDRDIDPGRFELVENVYRKTIVTYEYKFDQAFDGVEGAFEYIFDNLASIIEQCIAKYKGVSASISLNCTMVDMKTDVQRKITLYSPFYKHFNARLIESNIMVAADYLLASLAVLNSGTSGFRLHEINFINLRIADYRPIIARGYIETPKGLPRKFVLNINTDLNCFAFCIIAALKQSELRLPGFPDLTYEEMTRSQRQKLRKLSQMPETYMPFLKHALRTNEINFDGVLDDFAPEAIVLFEKNNPNISVSLYTHSEGKQIHPFQVTQKAKEHHIDLLILKKPKPGLFSSLIPVEFEYHYVVIDLPGIVGKDGHHRSSLCPYCFQKFITSLDKHLQVCSISNGPKIKFPDADNYEFNKWAMYEDIPFKLAFTFQFFPTPERGVKSLKVAGYAFCLIGPKGGLHNQFHRYEHYHGLDSVKKFMDDVNEISKYVTQKVRSTNIPVQMTSNNWKDFNLATHCEFCKKKFSPDVRKALDHSHVTGEFRRALCSVCNTLCRLSSNVLLVGFNINERELDQELIKKTKIIAKSAEEIVSLSVNGLRFYDLKLFLNTEEFYDLVQRQRKGVTMDNLPSKFPTFYSVYDNNYETVYLLDKIGFPYKYVDCQLKFKAPDLPPIEFFENYITGEEADPDEFLRATHVYENFDCVNLEEFSTHLLLSKVLLIADVLISFIEFMIQNFEISPLHSYSLGQYTFEAAFCSNNETYEYVKDVEILSFIKSGIRAGASMSVTKYCESNSPELKHFNGDYKNQSRCIVIDQNNQYTNNLLGYVPVGGYRFLSDEEFENLPEESEIGYLCCVSLHTPPHLHEKFDQLPLAITKRKVLKSELSEYQQNMYEELAQEITMDVFGSEVIVSDLHDKIEYTCYYTNLKYYLSQGLKITKRWKCLEFRQSKILKPYLEKVLNLRKTCKDNDDEFGSMLCKNLGVQLFGKLMQTSEKFTDVKICLSQVEAIKFLSKHNFVDYRTINEELGVTLFHFKKTSIYYKFPLLMSLVCLEKSKIDLHKAWDLMCATFDGVILIFSETDSIAMHFKIESHEKFIAKLKELDWFFDFSSLHVMHQLYSTKNAMVGGKWKIVYLDAISICSLRPKLYSILLKCFKCGNQAENYCSCLKVKKASGVPLQCVKHLTHDFFKECIFSKKAKKITFSYVESKNHTLAVVESSHHGIHALNIRRYQCKDGVNSFAFGNSKIKSEQNVKTNI